MCLAIPGLVEEVYNKSDPPFALVSFGGIKRRICITYTPEIKTGEYVLVHVGFALTKVDEEEAKATLCALANEELDI